MIKSDTCSKCKQQQDLKKSMWFIVWIFPGTVDSWNENGHLDSARNADSVQCSVLRPLVTESACKCYTPPSSLTASMSPLPSIHSHHPWERVGMTHQAFCQSSVAVTAQCTCKYTTLLTSCSDFVHWLSFKYSPFCPCFVCCPRSCRNPFSAPFSYQTYWNQTKTQSQPVFC